MLDLSMGEIGVIAAIALVVLGPDKLPSGSKKPQALLWGKAQRFVSQVKNDIDKEVELSGTEENSGRCQKDGERPSVESEEHHRLH